MAPRRSLSIAAGVALTLGLSACGDDTTASDEGTPTVTVTVEPTEEATPTQSETATEEPSDAANAGTAAEGEVPDPGTAVQVGDAVTLHVQALEEGDEYYGYALVSTTVTEIVEADTGLFEQAANAADFLGLSPWFVKVDFEWTTYEGKPNSNMLPRIGAVNSSGGELSPVLNSTWSAGIPGCEIEMPDQKGVGERASNCIVFAVPEGESIGAAVWRGDDTIDGYGTSDGNEYYADPIRWELP